MIATMTLPSERILQNSGLLRSRTPDRFLRQDQHQPLPSHDCFSSHATLPTVDLHSARPEEQLAAACRDWGFFQIRNHGVSRALLDRLRAHSHAFFELPLQQKNRAAANRANNFYGYGVAEARTYFSDDWMEAFDMEWTPVSRIRHHFEQLALPQAQLQNFSGVVEEYASKTERLAMELTELVAIGLGLEATTFSRHCEESSTSTVRMNYYPPCPQPSHTFGISPHSDFNIFTILLQNNVPGLQVLKDSEWITVEPNPDTLVVNVGDTFQAWGNGRIRSVMHRALVNPTTPRLSVVHFFGPHPVTVIVPPPALVDEEHPLLYRAFAYKEMVEHIMHIRGRTKTEFQSPLHSFLIEPNSVTSSLHE